MPVTIYSKAPPPQRPAPIFTQGQEKVLLRKLTWIFGLAFGGTLLCCLLGLLTLYVYFHKELPELEALEVYEPPLITVLYSVDNEVIEEFAGQRRILVKREEIPDTLVNALLATEDSRFYSHWGVDIWRIIGAMIVDVRSGSMAQGASTVTQQLARTLYLTREKSITRKLKEVLTAIDIEKTYSKEEILETYLNQHYLGKGTYGVEAGARYYFGKSIREVTPEEGAYLIGLLKAPNRYSNDNVEGKQRRNLVLDAMARAGYLRRAQADSLEQEDMHFYTAPQVQKIGAYFAEYCRQQIEKELGDSVLYRDGVTVHTTLNMKWQRRAEEVFNEKTRILQRGLEVRHLPTDPGYGEEVKDSATGRSTGVWRYKQIQGAMLAMEPASGEIRVLIGGRNFEVNKFNRAVQALRQPGSSFKPFIYTTAIDNGYSPCDKIDDAPIVIPMDDGTEWRPSNYDKKFKGLMTLRDALKESRNLVSIRLQRQLNVADIIKYAHAMGITTKLSPVPSLAVGSCEVRLIDMVTAYSVLANGGMKVPPTCIKTIENRKGELLKENRPKKEEVLSASTAYIMTTMLKTVIDQGTGHAARVIKDKEGHDFARPAAGKTGTTNDFTDAWFMGFTPDLACGVRIGFDDMTSLGDEQTGSACALPIWTLFMIEAHKGIPATHDFIQPPDVVEREACKISCMLARPGCPKILEYFKVENAPKELCSGHRGKSLGSTDGSVTTHKKSGGTKAPAEESSPRKSGSGRERLTF